MKPIPEAGQLWYYIYERVIFGQLISWTSWTKANGHLIRFEVGGPSFKEHEVYKTFEEAQRELELQLL